MSALRVGRSAHAVRNAGFTTALLALCSALPAPLVAQSLPAQIRSSQQIVRGMCCSPLAQQSMPATAYGASISRVETPHETAGASLHGHSPELGPAAAQGVEAAGWDSENLEAMSTQLNILQAEQGPMSAELAPPLEALGNALVAARRDDEAITTLKRSMHLYRVNEGLYTPTQIPLLEQLIELYRAQGDFAAVDQHEAYLFRVRKPLLTASGPAALEATQRYADWVRAAYLGDIDSVRFKRLVGLHDLYEQPLKALQDEHGEHSPRLLPYLDGLMDAAYLISAYPGEREAGVRTQMSPAMDLNLGNVAQLRFWRLRDHNFRNGLQLLQQREQILQQDPNATPTARAAAHLAIADWYQWHRRQATAIPLYEETWAMLDGVPDGAQWRQQHLGEPRELPATGVFKPGAVPLNVLHNETVTVRFSVSRRGEARDIEIVEASSEPDVGTRVHTFDYLRKLRFRPSVQQGRVIRSAPVQRTYMIRF